MTGRWKANIAAFVIVAPILALLVAAQLWLNSIAGAQAQPTGTNSLPPGFPLAVGPKPTLSGTCTTAGLVGGTFAGSLTATCSAQTIILTFPFPAPNGWACDMNDETTTTDTMKQSAHSTTSATMTGTAAASDVLSFKCAAY